MYFAIINAKPVNKLPQIYGILLALLTVGLHFLSGRLFPGMTELLYLHFIYVVVKWVLWPLTVWPVSAFSIFAGFVFIIFGFWVYRAFQMKFSIWKFSLGVLNVAGLLIGLFYLNWGFNYSLPKMVERLGWDVPEYEASRISSLYASVTHEMLSARKDWVEEGTGSPNLDEDFIRSEVGRIQKAWLIEKDLYVSVPAQIRPLPKGLLLRISTAGFYFPFGGEGYWDAGLHDLVVPFVMAHELAHNYGITDEGEANFIAFHTCIQSEHAFIRYCGYLNFWRYVARQFRYMDPEGFEKEWACLSDTIKNDLIQIHEQHDLYPDILPQVRDVIYDTFLRAQGVQSGLESYAEVVKLELAYRALENH